MGISKSDLVIGKYYETNNGSLKLVGIEKDAHIKSDFVCTFEKPIGHTGNNERYWYDENNNSIYHTRNASEKKYYYIYLHEISSVSPKQAYKSFKEGNVIKFVKQPNEYDWNEMGYTPIKCKIGELYEVERTNSSGYAGIFVRSKSEGWADGWYPTNCFELANAYAVSPESDYSWMKDGVLAEYYRTPIDEEWEGVGKVDIEFPLGTVVILRSVYGKSIVAKKITGGEYRYAYPKTMFRKVKEEPLSKDDIVEYYREPTKSDWMGIGKIEIPFSIGDVLKISSLSSKGCYVETLSGTRHGSFPQACFRKTSKSFITHNFTQGRWYKKLDMHMDYMGCFDKMSGDTFVCKGYIHNNVYNYTSGNLTSALSNAVECTYNDLQPYENRIPWNEISYYLETEVKKRYKTGDIIKCLSGYGENAIDMGKALTFTDDRRIVADRHITSQYHPTIYQAGEWAKVVGNIFDKPLTPSESKQAMTKDVRLSQEAERRGYIKGTPFIDLVHGDNFIVKNNSYAYYPESDTLYVNVWDNVRGNKTARIYAQGRWASITRSTVREEPTESKLEAIGVEFPTHSESESYLPKLEKAVKGKKKAMSTYCPDVEIVYETLATRKPEKFIH